MTTHDPDFFKEDVAAVLALLPVLLRATFDAGSGPHVSLAALRLAAEGIQGIMDRAAAMGPEPEVATERTAGSAALTAMLVEAFDRATLVQATAEILGAVMAARKEQN